MEKKKTLERGIWIDDDLTRRERGIQQRLWARAREEREKGNEGVRVGYQKIFLRGKWRGWQELEQGREVRIEEAREGEESDGE